MNILAVIPARGGSKGIPRKNVRILCGKPLICYSIENAINSKYINYIAVTTDDEEVKFIAKKYNVNVIDRPARLCEDSITLDPVIYDAVQVMERKEQIKFDLIITLQPTSPLLTSEILDSAIEYHIKLDIDTVISGVNDSHLAWGKDDTGFYPLYSQRVNRQYLPKHLKETGAFVITKREFVTWEGRFGDKISIFEMPVDQSIDIDTWQDWVLAEAHINKKNILFRIDGYNKIGLGHIYRALLLAYNFTEHNVMFCLKKKSDIGIEKIKESFFKYFIIENDDDIFDIIRDNNVDIVINDILDTDEKYIKELKLLKVRVINFEDLGEGNKYADVVINALYEKQFDNNNFYWGKEYYCLRDEFINANRKTFASEVKNILVAFGGTDACNLTSKMFEAIKQMNNKKIEYTFIIGLGYEKYREFIQECEKCDLKIHVIRDVKNISQYMSVADLAVSSQGRTMFELASMHVPTILVAQNEREQKHGFGDLSNGFLNLGLGENINCETLKETLEWLINTPSVRKNMFDKMNETDILKGTERVKKIILGK